MAESIVSILTKSKKVYLEMKISHPPCCQILPVAKLYDMHWI